MKRKSIKILTVLILVSVSIQFLFFSGCLETIDYRQKMREFVQNINLYAKSKNDAFIIIPQNGIELITMDGEPTGNLSDMYLQSFDAVGQESLFYGYHADNQPTPENEREWLLGFLERIKEQEKQVLVTDYCWETAYIDDSYEMNNDQGFLSFAADHISLDNIPFYPVAPINENDEDITSLYEAKNFLYLIDPFAYSNKEIYIKSLSETNYDLIIMDLFYDLQLQQEDILRLKTKENGGTRLLICYMSIGEAEDYRYYWQPEWHLNPPDWIDDENPDWEGNYKVHYWNESWQRIIYGSNDSYLNRIISIGFDGVYLDIIDAFEYFETFTINKIRKQ